MKLPEWLAAVPGRTTAMAEHFGITPAAVVQWKTNGVPVNRMRAVRAFTRRAVTFDEMVPELVTREQA